MFVHPWQVLQPVGSSLCLKRDLTNPPFSQYTTPSVCEGRSRSLRRMRKRPTFLNHCNVVMRILIGANVERREVESLPDSDFGRLSRGSPHSEIQTTSQPPALSRLDFQTTSNIQAPVYDCEYSASCCRGNNGRPTFGESCPGTRSF